MDRERIKLLIELSSSVDEADSVVIEAGFKAIREKLAFVKEMFDIKLIGRYSPFLMMQSSRWITMPF